jgi:hypothetical protein
MQLLCLAHVKKPVFMLWYNVFWQAVTVQLAAGSQSVCIV